MRIVFDENISHRLVDLLAKCGAPGKFAHTRTHGWNGLPDLEWMTHAIRADFIIVTADRNDRTRELAAEDFKAMQARVLLLGPFWDHLSIWEKTKWFVAGWDRLHARLSQLPEGSCVLVDKAFRLRSL